MKDDYLPWLFDDNDALQVLAAHICYLVAEANFEPYSDSARICLIGADHWKFPRTYATPEAIQVCFTSLSPNTHKNRVVVS